jgi:hypothetical protein
VKSLRDKSPLHWLKQVGRAVLWLLAAGLPIVTAIFIAGPDAIRSFPKVPGALRETFERVLYDAWLDEQLTGVWSNRADQAERTLPSSEIITMELWVNDGLVNGTLSAPTMIGKWRPNGMLDWLPSYPTALLKGEKRGDSLDLTVYDFLDNKQVIFAKLSVEFREEATEGIVDRVADDGTIRDLHVKAVWQVSESLPKTFVLSRQPPAR